MRLLLVEDDERLSKAVSQGLKDAGFVTDSVRSAEESRAALDTTTFDAIVLDLGLPDEDGTVLLKNLRNMGNTTPILILTARDGLQDRVQGLNAGADDYLLKPFAMEELVARIKALLRRPGAVLGMTLTAGNLRFDTVARSVTIDGKPITMTQRELGLLELLMRRIGKTVPKNVIEENIYGFNEEISSNSVEVAVHRLRKKLDKHKASICIHTVRGVGYILNESHE